MPCNSSRPTKYREAWRVRHEAAAHRWLATTAVRRRWLSAEGHEWRLAACAGSFTGSFHVLRLLAGGVRGAAQRRGRSHCRGGDGMDLSDRGSSGLAVVQRVPAGNGDGHTG